MPPQFKKEISGKSLSNLVTTKKIELGPKLPSLSTITIGSLENPLEQNFEILGEFLANNFIEIIKDAKTKNRKVAFDMPTGSSPESFYKALKRIVQTEKIDLSKDVIFFGHEAEWPPAVDNPSLDYENQRKKILTDLGVEIKEITEPGMEGNYVPMYQEALRDGASNDEIKNTALKSAKKYDEILETILDRKDEVVSVGYYGVGVDGHGFGELQLFHMWDDEWPKTENTFITSIGDYNLERELWRLTNVWNRTTSDSNALWGKIEQFPNVKYLMGLGRKTMNKLDHSIHIFNNPKKYFALYHTLISLAGSGRGESMLGIFKSFASQLKQQGIDLPEMSDVNDCHQIVRQILSSLGPDYKNENYFKIAELIEVYFGLKTPINMAVLERAKLGKSSTLIMPANVLKGEEYEFLTKENN